MRVQRDADLKLGLDFAPAVAISDAHAAMLCIFGDCEGPGMVSKVEKEMDSRNHRRHDS